MQHASLIARLSLTSLLLNAAAISIAQNDTGQNQQSAVAESKPGTKAPRRPQFNPFGDASRFTRYGGWGGIGGAAGQWGFGRSMLVMMPAVQEELKLTDDQKQKLRDWSKQMRTQFEESGQELREQGEAAVQRMDLGAVMRLMGSVKDLTRQNDAGLAQILTRVQQTRLEQILLQMEGVTAIARPEIAEQLQLTDEQAQQIEAIITESRTRQMGFWVQQAMGMRQAMRRDSAPATGKDQPGKEKETKKPAKAAKPADPAALDDPEEEQKRQEAAAEAEKQKARGERIQKAESRFQTMRDGADKLQDQTVEQILKALAPGQRKIFDKLLGPPFDPSRLMPGAGGSPQGVAAESSTAPEAESTAGAAKKSARLRPAPRIRSATDGRPATPSPESPK